MTSAAELSLPSSGADRQNVCAIGLSGVQNPLPTSHSMIIEKAAMTAPPAIPPAIPARKTLPLIRPSPLRAGGGCRRCGLEAAVYRDIKTALRGQRAQVPSAALARLCDFAAQMPARPR